MNRRSKTGEGQPRLFLVTGKGGVGKTTIAAALGLASANQGLRTLVCELKTQGRLAESLGHGPIGSQITPLEENLWAVNIDPLHAMEEYGLLKLRFRTLYRLVFNNPLVKALVRFVPGMDDLLMLGKIYNHEREVDGENLPVWDRIIVDAPATGHGLTFFRLPKVIRDAVPSGNMHTETAEMWSLLRDPTKTRVHVITLPEELPVEETAELSRRLTQELGLPLGRLIVNGSPVALDHSASRLLSQLSETTLEDQPRLQQLRKVGLMRQNQADNAVPSIEAAMVIDPQSVVLPRFYVESVGRTQLEHLADALVKEGIA